MSWPMAMWWSSASTSELARLLSVLRAVLKTSAILADVRYGSSSSSAPVRKRSRKSRTVEATQTRLSFS